MDNYIVESFQMSNVILIDSYVEDSHKVTRYMRNGYSAIRITTARSALPLQDPVNYSETGVI